MPEAVPHKPHPFERLGTPVSLLLMALSGLAFVSTAATTSAARLAVMQPIETYALAVHHQLVRNHALTGRWSQTIHFGYEDAWTWSGHHALTLLAASGLYPLLQGVLGLTVFQIVAVALGAIPAAIIGRRAARSRWGLGLGAGLYLLHPAVMAQSLQDYQDLVFALPALLTLVAALGARSPLWLPPALLIGLAPREECIPLVVVCALITWPPGGIRRWLAQLGLTAAVAGIYAGVLGRYFPATTGIQGPDGSSRLGEAVALLLDRGPTGLDGWPHLLDFYSLAWSPVGGLALLSPLSLLPAVPLTLLHMAIPDGNGIDRSWAGHAHHLTPTLFFVVLATIEGAGRLARGIATLSLKGRKLGPPLALAFGSLLLLVNLRWTATWALSYGLLPALWPEAPPYEHPAWTLARRLPAEAVPVVSTRYCIAVSGLERSYTWEESLYDKAGRRGLGAASHLIAPRSAVDVVEWAMAMPGARVVDEHDGYLTVAWEAGAWEAGASDRSGRSRQHPWPNIPDWTPAGHSGQRLPGVPRR